MAAVSSNNNQAAHSLWQLARVRWVKNIHKEIESLGIGPDKNGKKMFSRIQTERSKDGVPPGKRARGHLSGRATSFKVTSDPFKSRSRRSFYRQLDLRKKRESKFEFPVPCDQKSSYRRAYLKRNYPFGSPRIEPNFQDHTKGSRSARHESHSNYKLHSHSGGFANPMLDEIVDTMGIIADLLVCGVRDVSGSLFTVVP